MPLENKLFVRIRTNIDHNQIAKFNDKIFTSFTTSENISYYNFRPANLKLSYLIEIKKKDHNVPVKFVIELNNI